MRKSAIAFLSLSIILGLTFNAYFRIDWGKTEAFADTDLPSSEPSYEYEFSHSQTIEEAETRGQSDSDDWWLRSGGGLIEKNGSGRTLEDSLQSKDSLRVKYAKKAPIESDNGYHPQNIFRLLSQKEWDNFDQTVTFKMLGENIFNPQNSHEWNAISLLARHHDEDNYYYAGIRMDGVAVIKKKREGEYSTLAEEQFFTGDYDPVLNPNIIPKNKEMGLRMKIHTTSDGDAVIEFYVDKSGNGSWELAADAVDNGTVGGKPITGKGSTGIYADYMDAEFSEYKVWEEGATVVKSTDDSDSSGNSDNEDDADAPAAPANDREEESSSAEDNTDNTDDSADTDDADDEKDEEESKTEEKDEEPGLIEGALYGLSKALTVSETGSFGESSSSDWWVNSGGYFTVSGGVGKTVQGKLPSNDKWRLAYSKANPTDTEDGYQPQNIFRLITKSTYKNYVEQAYFKMNAYNKSSSPNRDGHNGLLFFNRYKDGDNLYYTGIRVDGSAVIKKKVGGTYYTLALEPVYTGSYDRNSKPNLIPTGKWIGMRSEVKDLSDGSVSIKFYMDTVGNGSWKLVAETVDNGKQGAKVSGKYSAGIRTDFADVEVKDYSIKEL